MGNFYGNILKHFQEAFSLFSFHNAGDTGVSDININAMNTKDKIVLSADRWIKFKKYNDNPDNHIVQISHAPADAEGNNHYINLKFKNNEGIETNEKDISSEDNSIIVLTSSKSDATGHLNGILKEQTISININQEKKVRKEEDSKLQNQIGAISDNPKEEKGKSLSIQTENIRKRVTASEGNISTLTEQIKGLTGAMHFIGVLSELPKTTSGYANGDVVLVGTKEYVANGEKWVELGDTTKERIDINANTKAIQTINGNELEEGSIKKAINDLAQGQVEMNKNNIELNTTAIETINNPSLGILAQAKEYTNSFDERITANTTNINKINSEFKDITITTVKPSGEIISQKFTNTHNSTYEAARYFAQTLKYSNDKTLVENVQKNTENISAINDSETGILATAKKYTDTTVSQLTTQGQVAINTSAINAINNPDTGILANAKTYTDSLTISGTIVSNNILKISISQKK